VKLVAILGSLSVLAAVAAVFLYYYSPSTQDVMGQVTTPRPISQVAGLQFEKAVNLTNNTNDSVYGQVVASGDNVYVVWQDSVPSTDSGIGRYVGRNYDIFVMQSNDAGESFGTPVNLSLNPGFSEHPQAAVASSGLHVVWADDSYENREVIFTRSANGTDFGPQLNLSNSTSDSFNQEIAAFGDDVYVVWLEEDQAGSKVLLRASHDGGKSFEDRVVISDLANVATLPKVSAHGQAVHVAWSLIDDENENGLFYSASTDKGSRFSQPKKLSDQNDFGEPQIVADNNTVYVVSGGIDIIEVNGLLVAKSVDGGANFSTEMITVNGSFVNPLNVEAALDNSSMLYVAGQVYATSNEEILLLPLDVQTDDLKPMGLANLSENPKISECPSIAISGDKIFVVWEDLSPGNHEILYSKVMKS
jgi:hypothetical protein